jgi:hypothetical protein
MLALLDRPEMQNAERFLNPSALRLRKKMCFLWKVCPEQDLNLHDLTATGS